MHCPFITKCNIANQLEYYNPCAGQEDWKA